MLCKRPVNVLFDQVQEECERRQWGTLLSMIWLCVGLSMKFVVSLPWDVFLVEAESVQFGDDRVFNTKVSTLDPMFYEELENCIGPNEVIIND